VNNLSTTHEACLAVGLEDSKVKYGLFKEEFLSEIEAENKNSDDELTFDDLDKVIFKCTGDWAYSFGDLGYEWFSGFKFKCEEELSDLDFKEVQIAKSNFQDKLNELTKGENLINFEIRVIKHVY
jgi:hypothetical protein